MSETSFALGREAVAVRTARVSNPSPHEHVTALRLNDGSLLSGPEIVAAINEGERLHMEGLVIHVAACAICGAYPQFTVLAW